MKISIQISVSVLDLRGGKSAKMNEKKLKPENLE
jgi:hypothetical protein